MKKLINVAWLCGALAFGAHATQAATFETVYQFSGSDGSFPAGPLVVGPSGTLYGTTYEGGSGGGGTIFSLDPATGDLTTLYAFSKSGGGGNGPVGGLVLEGENLFGVTEVGGAASCSNGCGTVFELNIKTGNFTTLYAFSGLTDGSQPEGRLRFDKTRTILYGTTLRGGNTVACGAFGCGTVFELVPKTKIFNTLHQFSDDALPDTGLTVDSTGLIYGVTTAGGQHGSGTLFVLDPVSQAYDELHQFNYHVDGSDSLSDLLLKKGLLYGTTATGGPSSSSDGTVFVFDIATRNFSTLYSLNGNPDGLSPQGLLVAGKHNLIYGAANQGGASGAGTIFSLNTKTLAYNLVYAFKGGADGALPGAGLAIDKSGVLWGVTSYQHGTIFKITP